ncbi:MAG TPA: phosphodiester glycosidase family protein [Actinomycetes bacterium]|nr:phosphodiester glycosidase family protein [Actinomycetes bacterium]
MTAVRVRKGRLLAIPVSLAVLGGALLAGSAGVDAAAPCDMRVTTNRTASQTLSSGVELNTYKVSVTSNRGTQSAVVQRMMMPAGAKPKLVHRRLGLVGTLRDQIAGRSNRTVAAINGDFFYEYSTGMGRVVLPRGVSISRGRIIRADDEDMRVVGVDASGKPYTGMMHVGGTVSHGSDSFVVSGLNWHWLGAAGVVVYTHQWADGSVAQRPLATVEWVVRHGRIKDVRTGTSRGADVGRGTKVVAFGSDHATAAKRARVGDRVAISTRQVTSGGVTLREGVGRGAALVRGGAIAFDCGTYSSVVRPRTTVGWTAKGRWATLIVPGSGYDRYGYRIGGLGLPQEANVARELGFASADELDGGGSVTSYVRRGDSSWDRVDTADSYWARPIPNGLVFVKR